MAKMIMADDDSTIKPFKPEPSSAVTKKMLG
jgi:hypothetical protein